MVEAESEEREVIKPAPLQVALLYKIMKAQREILAVNQQLLEIEKKRVPQGLIQPVTLSATEEMKTYEPPTPWFSVDVYNEGPDTVYVGINDKAREFKSIEKNRARRFDFGMAKIEKVYYKCARSETATVELTGTY